MTPMAKRMAAIEACQARFLNKPYEPGKRDCLKLVKHALHTVGRRVGLASGVRYSTEAGAVRALRKLGFKTLVEAVDASGLIRIAPAMALPGDILALQSGEDGFGCALALFIGNGKAMTFVGGVCVQGPLGEAPMAAWRLI